jgi:acetyl esterase/lipase
MNERALSQLGAAMQRIGAQWLDALRPPSDVARLRVLMREVCALGSAPPGTAHRTVRVGAVPCEWVLTPQSDLARRLVYLHGGGYIVGDVEMYRPLAAQLAHATRCSVLSVDYRLAPEHACDAPREDAIAAFAWACQNGPAGPGVARRVFIGGDSAGGGIAIAAAQALRDSADREPDAVIGLSPAVDVSSIEDRVPPDQRELVAVANALFLRDRDPRDPLVSPGLGVLEGLPPLLVQYSEAEPAREQNERFVSNARRAGVDVTCEPYAGMPHVWHLYAPTLPQAVDAIASIGRFTQRFV